MNGKENLTIHCNVRFAGKHKWIHPLFAGPACHAAINSFIWNAPADPWPMIRDVGCVDRSLHNIVFVYEKKYACKNVIIKKERAQCASCSKRAGVSILKRQFGMSLLVQDEWGGLNDAKRKRAMQTKPPLDSGAENHPS